MRERTIVVNSILMPIFLYPVLLWVMFTGMTFVQGLNEGFTSRVAFTTPAPPGHPALLDSLRASERMTFHGSPDRGRGGGDGADEGGDAGPRTPLPVTDPDEARRLLEAGEVDAVVAFDAPPPGGAALSGNFSVTILYDRSESRSQAAQSRLWSLVASYRDSWMEEEAAELGMSPSDRSLFTLASESVSSGEEMGTVIMGQMFSFFIVIMVALGCFIPSVDTTAGERERSTWETLMTVAASRASVVTAKYLYVATLGIMAGILNVVALFLSIGAVMKPLLADASSGMDAVSFSLPLASIPVMIAGAGALALFFSAAMMILASFARTFKDGQAMVQPVYWLVFLPLLLGNQSGQTLTPVVASIPVINISMMIRDAIHGVYIWPLIAQSLAVTLVTVVLCLAMARHVLRFEDFLLGSFDGSFWRFAKSRLATRGQDA